jgi:pimeloyl-ACP methyl ester carboxylesterase
MNLIPSPARASFSSYTFVKYSAATLFSMLCACQDLTVRATRAAQHAGLTSATVQGTQYQHEIFVHSSTPGDTLFVFIEGDGSPWSRDGLTVSRDPTPHRALALELAEHTPHSILYLGRPCYFSARTDSGCNTRLWTSERYSARVVESLAAVVNRYAANNAYRRVTLIGYSGGGALAVLMAPRIPSTGAVITIAANLDVEAWASWHGYLPLEGSLNPATEAPLDPAIQQWHLVGDRDLSVPPRVSRRYLGNVRAERIWHFASFDHVCCWVEQWSSILPRIEAALADSVTASENTLPAD